MLHKNYSESTRLWGLCIYYLLILDKRSLMRRVRLSRFFICSSYITLSMRAMSEGDHDINTLVFHAEKIKVHVLIGMAIIMIATPTNAAHPRRLYTEIKARVIWVVQLKRETQIRIDNFTWSGPEIAISPYVQKSCSRVASTDMRLTISPEARLCSLLARTRDFA